MTKPTIIVIPGSFSTISGYAAVIAELEAHGYAVHGIELETVGRRMGKAPDMYADTAKVAALVSKLADEGKDVVLVPHSYGGIVALEASKGLAKSVREKAGKTGGVARIVLVTAVAPLEGQTVKDLFGEALDFMKNEVSVQRGSSVGSGESADQTEGRILGSDGRAHRRGSWVLRPARGGGTKMGSHDGGPFGGELRAKADLCGV